jgi:aminoglycoside phosphotransferase (APT) family kinase protein
VTRAAEIVEYEDRLDRIDFDPARLAQFLKAELGTPGDLRLQRIGGGQSNPTYFVDFAGRRMVLRKQPAGPILRGAHAVDREFRVLSALSGTEVPVPRPILFHADPEPLGTPFYLMERVEGRIFHDTALPGVQPRERRHLYLAMAETLAKLHAVPPDAIGLSDFGRPGNYFERQLARWTKQWKESPTRNIPDLDHLSDWLCGNLPSDDGHVSIAHGDFRLGNLMFHPSAPRVIAILDWELSTIGHPLADLGFCCIPWATTPDEYGGILGLDHSALGIPSRRSFVAHYFANALPTAPLQPFHVAFALFRFAVIFVGIADRVSQGTAAGENADRLAPLAARFARRGLDVARVPGSGLEG